MKIKKIKRIIALVMAVTLFVSVFAACTKSSTKTTTTAETTASSITVDTNNWTKYDALIAQIKASTDFTAREALMHQAEDILMNTGAVCPIYYYNDIYMMKPGLEGMFATVTGYKFFMYATLPGATKLRINLASEPAKLDPALNSSVDGAILAANSFAGLYTYDSSGKTIPALAKSYTVSADGMTYIFTMKDNLKWSDGSALSAKDLEYSWKRAASTETAADYSYMFNGIKGYGTKENIDVKASDDGKTLTVVLMAPCAYFLDLCAFPTFFAVKQSQVESAKGYKDASGKILNPGAWATEAGFVSSGAYTLQSWNHNTSMVYVKNPNYWDAANVKMDKLEFMLSADDTAIYAAYKAGNLDFIDTVPTDEIKALLTNPEFHIVDQLGTYYIAFNVKSALFKDKTVAQADAMRKGLGLLIDRKYIIDTVGQTGQKIANAFIPEGMKDGHGGIFKTNDTSYTYPVKDDVGYFSLGATQTTYDANVQAGIALLKTAGFEFDASGKLSASTPLSFDYLINENTGHQQIAECLQQDFAAVGITMNIKTKDWDTFLAERKAGNFDVARDGWIADFNDPINMLEMWGSTSGNNDCQLGK
jgi:peptide/nickel transport system substrate-binding protein/oligopeptide transport system substrate-binding protein